MFTQIQTLDKDTMITHIQPDIWPILIYKKTESYENSVLIPPSIRWWNILHIQRPIGKDKQSASKKLRWLYMDASRERPLQSGLWFTLHRAVDIHTPAWLNVTSLKHYSFRLVILALQTFYCLCQEAISWGFFFVRCFVCMALHFPTIPGWMIAVCIAPSLMLGGRAATWSW